MELEGARLSHYRLGARLGEGGMGVVHRAHDERLQRDVAIKLLPPSMHEDPRARARLLREARMASSLSHPNVASVFEAGETEGHAYIVMELVDGRSLKEMVPKDGLTPRTVCRYGAQIADALDHAHRRGIVHRDLKLSNVMVTGEGRVKVLDFGLSRHGAEHRPATGVADRSLTLSGTLVGTPLYLAPEVWRGGKADERSDIWALGIVLYEMATGRSPFTGGTEYELSASILHADPEPMPQRVPLALVSLVHRCLEKDPRHRVQTVAEVRAALDALAPDPARAVAQRQPGSRRVAARQPASRAVPARRPASRVIAVTLATIAAALGGWIGWQAFHHPWPGGTPQQKQLTFNSVENPIVAAAISPDGRMLAYVDTEGFFLRSIETGEIRELPRPLGWEFYFMFPPYLAWFPDGLRILASTSSGIWEIPTQEGNLTRLDSKYGAMALGSGVAALSRDGARIAVSTDSGRAVATLTAHGTDLGAPIRLSDKAHALVALAWSPSGERIAFLTDEGHGSAPGGCALGTIDLKTRRVSIAGSDTFLVDRSAYSGGRQICWLPDGRLVYSRGERTRGDLETNLWSLRLDPRTGRRSGDPRRLTSRAGDMQVYLSATADGRRICFLSNHPQSDIYTGVLEAGTARLSSPRRLTLDDRMDDLCGWLSDSRSVLFASDRNGTYDVFRQGLGDVGPRVLVSGPGAQGGARATPDGASVLYLSAPYEGEVPNWERAENMRLDLATGETRPCGIPGAGTSIACASTPAGRCVLAEWKDNRLTFYAVDSSWTRGRELAHADSVMKHAYSWSLSPDGSRVVIGRHSFSSTTRFTVVDLANGTSNEMRSPDGIDLDLPICWSADGRGLVATGNVRGENVILWADLGGHARILYRSSEEILNVIPSPDGRQLAFGILTRAASAWMLQGY